MLDATDGPSTTLSQGTPTALAVGHGADDGLDQSNPSDDELLQRAHYALQQVEADRTFPYWLDIGAAVQIGRTTALRKAQTNRPTGRHYSVAFGTWLVEHGFDRIDKGTRCDLLKCLDRRTEVEAWRAALPISKRFQLNHPSTVWRHFKAAHRPTKTPTETSTEITTEIPAPALIDAWKAAGPDERNTIVPAELTYPERAAVVGSIEAAPELLCMMSDRARAELTASMASQAERLAKATAASAPRSPPSADTLTSLFHLALLPGNPYERANALDRITEKLAAKGFSPHDAAIAVPAKPKKAKRAA